MFSLVSGVDEVPSSMRSFLDGEVCVGRLLGADDESWVRRRFFGVDCQFVRST